MRAEGSSLEELTLETNEPPFRESDQTTDDNVKSPVALSRLMTYISPSTNANTNKRFPWLDTSKCASFVKKLACNDNALIPQQYEDARAAAFEAPWTQNIPSAPSAEITSSAVDGVPVLAQLHAVLVLYNQRLDDGYLPHLFFERLLRSIELYGPHCPLDMAYVLGDMMTRALDAHDAYAKASRAVYFWCIAVTPQLDAFQELLMSGHLDDARTVLHSVYIGSADAMKTATGALATTKALLTYVEDEAMLFSARMRTGSLDQTPATTDGTKETIMSETSAHGAMTLVTSETMTTSSALVSLVPEKMQQIRKTIYKAYSACKEASILPWTAQPTTTCPPLTIDITMADALCNLATRLHTMAGRIEMGLNGLATTDVGSLVAKEVQHPKDLGKNARAHCEAASALCNACNEFIRNHKSHYACDLATTL